MVHGMRLYQSPMSSSSRLVRMTLKLLGLEADEVVVDLRNPDRSQLRPVNPNAKVPVLEDGAFVLWESHAIALYLCNKTPGQTLYPTELQARADVERWLFWISAQFSPTIGGLNFERFIKRLTGRGEADPAHVARLEATFHILAQVADAHLATRTWLSGPALTLADVSLACAMTHAKPAQLPLDAYPNLGALRQRVAELDAWNQTQPPQVG